MEMVDMTKMSMRGGQNTTVIPCGYVDPNALSNTQVGPGKYSLNKRSNVPFVGLIGSAGFRKVISWGEIAEIPPGQLVTVSNASYHGGDIFINKGPDICNRPSRITVPVQFQNVPFVEEGGDNVVWAADYPCDTRGAKRAYVNIDASTLSDVFETVIFVRARRLDGSMKTNNILQTIDAPWGPGVGFLSAVTLGSSTVLFDIPLGLNCNMGDDGRPHTLLDAGDAFVTIGPAGILGDVLEWPASVDVRNLPTNSETSAPGCWYTIEYD